MSILYSRYIPDNSSSVRANALKISLDIHFDMMNTTIIFNNVHMALIFLLQHYSRHIFISKVDYIRDRLSPNQCDSIRWKLFSNDWKLGTTWTCNQKFGILKFYPTSVITKSYFFFIRINRWGFYQFSKKVFFSILIF